MSLAFSENAARSLDINVLVMDFRDCSGRYPSRTGLQGDDQTEMHATWSLSYLHLKCIHACEREHHQREVKSSFQKHNGAMGSGVKKCHSVFSRTIYYAFDSTEPNNFDRIVRISFIEAKQRVAEELLQSDGTPKSARALIMRKLRLNRHHRHHPDTQKIADAQVKPPASRLTYCSGS